MVYINDHPLIRSKIADLQDPETKTKKFREIVEEITVALTYDALRDVPTDCNVIKSAVDPSYNIITRQVNQQFCVVPILRAGLGMSDAVLKVLPAAKTGHIGLYRDPETHFPVKYYSKFPPCLQAYHVLLVDPMGATGNSLSAALTLIRDSVPKQYRSCIQISTICLFITQKCIDTVQAAHPDYPIYAAFMSDAGLDDRNYIIDGCGDAGDRIFGTQ